MAPILKDSDTLTTPEATARSGSASPSSTESTVKAQPVALEIPITVNGVRTAEGSDKREPFSESTRTVMVFGSGAVIRLTSAMAPGQLLFLTNERTKKEVVCQVVKSKNYRSASGYVELEFTEPAVGFWGMRFPGDRIGPGPQATPAETRPPAAGNGAPTAAVAGPAAPMAPKTEPPAVSSAPSANVNVVKPSAPAPSVGKPAAPVTASSPIVPPVIDPAAFVSPSIAKPDRSVPPAPIATSLGADTPLIEPWLRKREPTPRVPVAQPSVAPPAPPTKPAEPEASLTPVRSFAVERSSDKPASLFAPVEAPASLANVDLSSLAPFFEVKPAVGDAASAPPKAPVASDPEMDELKRHTARLQDELTKIQFAETPSSSTTKPEAEKLEAKEPEAEKGVAPELETPSFPVTEQSMETLKTELVHENAVRLVENPEPTNAAPVLLQPSKLDEPAKVEPAATIPVLESLEQEEMQIPAWLAPLARNTSAPSSTQEPVLREKTKRRAEQPQLQELVAPLVDPKEEQSAAESRVPQFGSALPFEETKKARESSPKKSGKGMLLGGIAAGILALAGGGWWYMNQQAAGSHTSVATAGSTLSSSPAGLQTSAMKESVLGTAAPHQTDATVSEAKGAAVDSNATSNPAGNASSPASTNSAAINSREPQGSSNGLNGGNVVTKADSAEPEPVHEVEKKPALGEVHLAAPKVSQKRTVQTTAAPDAGILSEEQPGADADSLGGLAVANNQPAAPTAPVAVGGEVKQAKLVSSVQPAYPPMAKQQHVSGAVTIDALIDASGRVTTMNVLSGPALLQQAAMDALKQWKYQPATLDGKAVPMHLSVTLQFRLQE
jgi:TonB family protein